MMLWLAMAALPITLIIILCMLYYGRALLSTCYEATPGEKGLAALWFGGFSTVVGIILQFLLSSSAGSIFLFVVLPFIPTSILGWSFANRIIALVYQSSFQNIKALFLGAVGALIILGVVDVILIVFFLILFAASGPLHFFATLKFSLLAIVFTIFVVGWVIMPLGALASWLFYRLCLLFKK